MSLSNALNSIITKCDEFCCLCFISVGQVIRIEDEVIVKMNNQQQSRTMSEILESVLTEETYQVVSSFNSLCEKCAKCAINSYLFINTSQKNTECLMNAINGLSSSFEFTTNVLGDSKSLFVHLNLVDFSSKQYYDNKSQIKTKSGVIQRLKSLDEKLTRELNKKKKKKYPKNDVTLMTRKEMCASDDDTANKCKVCFRKFPSLWNLRNHYLRVHAPKEYKCSECPRSYGTVTFLEAHKTESHCKIVCSECGKTFNNRHTLKMHELGHHMIIVCPDCGRLYKNKTTFNKHKQFNVCGRKSRAHPSEAKYTCDYCNKKYTQKVSLRVHIQYEHGNYKAHICEWCGKKFWAQSRLKAHIVKHTKEKNFACSICNGKFVTKESLLYHTRIHTGEKPYECNHCKSRFLSASRRSVHIKRHHTGATLKCDSCDAKFNTWSYLLKHKKSHNSEGNQNKTAKHAKESKSVDSKNVEAVQSSSEDTTENMVHSFTHEVYVEKSETQQSEDDKIYLEVSDEGVDYVISVG